MKETVRKLVDQMAAANQRNPLTETDIDQLSGQFGLSRHAFFDEIAHYIASEFMAGQLSFEQADAAANDLFAYSCHIEDPLEGFAWDVFQAFDAGEFFHSPDGPGIDPVKKHTVPQLQAALATYGARA